MTSIIFISTIMLTDVIYSADNGVGSYPVRESISIDVLCEFFLLFNMMMMTIIFTDERNYSCTLGKKCDKIFPDPPEVHIERPWVHAAEDDAVTLVCRVYSNPLARVILHYGHQEDGHVHKLFSSCFVKVSIEKSPLGCLIFHIIVLVYPTKF